MTRGRAAGNAAFASRWLRLGRAEILRAGHGAPAVRGELRAQGATRTILLYAHHDGQPASTARWRAGAPFTPTLFDRSLEAGGKAIEWPQPDSRIDPEWRVYARSASDDKAAIVAMLTALDALRAAGIAPRANLRFLFDGEEELGSRTLPQLLARHRERFTADVVVFCDGPVHQTRRQQVAFGVRGTCGLEITVLGARRPLHSGHYGNWAPNPALDLAHLLASMKDRDGRVRVAGFYDDVEPLSEADKAALAAAPDIDTLLRDELWLAASEGEGRLDERLTLPSLNVRGLASADVGAMARNVIPDRASASLDCRLVKGMDPDRTLERLVAHARAQGFHVVEAEPDEAICKAHARVAWIVRKPGYPAVRTPMDSTAARAVVEAVRSARGDVVLLPTLGGSLPLHAVTAVLDVPVVVLPIANHDNNQHADDENIRLQNLWDGIETMAAVLAMSW